MRILLVTHFFPGSHTEGTENYTLGLATALLARGHTVRVVCAGSWDKGREYWNGATEDIYQGVPVHRLHLNWTRADNPNMVLYESEQVEDWLDQFLISTKPGVVHVTSTYTLGLGVLRSARRAGVPLVLTPMDFWFVCARTILVRGDGKLCDGMVTPGICQECLLFSSGFYRRTRQLLPSRVQAAVWHRITRTDALARLSGARGMALDMFDRKARVEKALELPDRILSHSRFLQSMFAETRISQRVEHLANGHDMSWMSGYPGKVTSQVLRFGFMGQVSPAKGVKVLVQAFRSAGLAGKARLEVWGDLEKNQDYSSQLKNLISDSDAIFLRGRFARNQLASVLAEIDVLVVPSLWYENAPLVIYEAFATGTPVVATDLGGMAEAVEDEVSGLLFERGNVADLARQLRRLTEEPGLLERLRAGIPPVKTIDEEVSQLEAIYQGLSSVPVSNRTNSTFGG